MCIRDRHGTFNRDELNALLDLAEVATDELMAKQREVLGTAADKVGRVYPTCLLNTSRCV